jgi:preprotein translocase subunit Sec61beta
LLARRIAYRYAQAKKMKFILPHIEKDLAVRNIKEQEDKKIIVERLNSINRTPFKSELIDNQIVIKKKMFSDFYPFNLYHLMSLQFFACSEYLENHKSNQIKFTIKPKLVVEVNTCFAVAVLIILIIGSFLTGEFIIGLITLLFFSLMILFERFAKKIGLRNFESNWDQYVN